MRRWILWAVLAVLAGAAAFWIYFDNRSSAPLTEKEQSPRQASARKGPKPNPSADLSTAEAVLNEWARLVGEGYDRRIQSETHDAAVIQAHEAAIDLISKDAAFAYLRAGIERFVADFPKDAQRPDSLLARAGRISPERVGVQIQMPNGKTLRIEKNRRINAVYKRPNGFAYRWMIQSSTSRAHPDIQALTQDLGQIE